MIGDKTKIETYEEMKQLLNYLYEHKLYVVFSGSNRKLKAEKRVVNPPAHLVKHGHGVVIESAEDLRAFNESATLVFVTNRQRTSFFSPLQFVGRNFTIVKKSYKEVQS